MTSHAGAGLSLTFNPGILTPVPFRHWSSEASLRATYLPESGVSGSGASITVECNQGLVSANDGNWSKSATGVTNDDGFLDFWLSVHWSTGGRPGSADLTVIVGKASAPATTVKKAITVVGPAASITMAAVPSSVRCGESVTITILLKDSMGQNVLNESEVVLYTNYGGVLAPRVARTYGGVATTFLLTSEAHLGPYEVVAEARSLMLGVSPIFAQVTIMAARNQSNRSSIDEIVLAVERARRATNLGSARVTKYFMFTDIVGSTELNFRLGDERWREISQEHNDLVRQAAVRFEGTEVKYLGDGFLFVFANARPAVEAAIQIQRALSDYRTRHQGEPRGELHVRIGIHGGEADQIGPDYSGECVNFAARIASEAEGSEILASDVIRAFLRGVPEIPFFRGPGLRGPRLFGTRASLRGRVAR